MRVKKSGISNLRVAGVSPYTVELSMAVRKDWPELAEILQIELDNLTDEEKTLMFEKWTNVQIQREVDWSKMIGWISSIFLVASVIIGLTLYTNRKLAREINERRKAQLRLKTAKEEVDAINVQLKESEEKYKKLIEGVDKDYVIYSHDLEGNFLYVNPGAEKIFGISANDLIGKNWRDTIKFTQESYKKAEEADLNHKEGKSQFIYQLEFIHPDGGLRVIEVNENSMKGTDNQNVIVYGIAKDITELKKREGEMRKAKEEAENTLEKLKTANKDLESFSYSVSHDLRAPLRWVSSLTQMFQEDYKDQVDEIGRSYINKIRDSVSQMDVLINDLLNLSTIGRKRIRKEDIDLTRIVVRTVDKLKNIHPDRKIDINIQEGLRAHGDQNLLRIVIDNLIGNAWKFTSNKENPTIEIGALKENGKTTYFVKDNGSGFDMEKAQQVFDPFKRLHKKTDFQGTGIGLAIVKRIISKHAGKIWAKSKPGEGATFFFRL